MARDVFISHSTRDKAVADEACAALEAAGHSCWVAPRNVRPGHSFAGEITRAIRQSKVMVLIFSGHSNKSEQVLREVQLATDCHLPIIRFRIEDVALTDDLTYFLSTPHWLDALTPPLSKHIASLEIAVKELLGLSSEDPGKGVADSKAPREESTKEAAPKVAAQNTSNRWKMALIAAAVLVAVVGVVALLRRPAPPAAQSREPMPSASSPTAPTPSPTATPTPPSTPRPPPAAQTVNLSTRMLVQSGDNVGIGGFIISGTASKHVLVRAIGPSLSQIGIPNALPDPFLELHGPKGFATVTNNNWREDPVQEALIIATGLAPSSNLESAVDANLGPGAYTAVVRGNSNATGVALIEVYDLNQAVPTKLANISTRAFVSTGDDIVIAGFILGNQSGNDRIVVRGIGPSLTPFGVPGALANPTLELRDNNGALLIKNNDWQDDAAQAAELTAAGLAPTNLLESGIAAKLPPGLYTALLTESNNGTGVGVVEVYDRGAP